MSAFTALNRVRVMRLYRRALKLQMSWTPRYDVFRSQAMEIRRRFEENKNVSDPRVLQKLIDDAEKELYENRHPDPYIRKSSLCEIDTSSNGTGWLEMGKKHSSTKSTFC
jgi:NADH dehydrogenase (ubiquinone) 1 beta subcomplex subunit 9